MTVEALREVVWAQYGAHIVSLRETEAGETKNPLLYLSARSDFPHDYDLRSCGADGSLLSKQSQPYQETRSGGNFLRAQLLAYTKPYYIAMVIGRYWLARDGMCEEENCAREECLDMETTVRNVIEVELCTASRNKLQSLEKSRVEGWGKGA